MTLSATPQGISVISMLNGLCLRISWGPVSGTLGYNVYRSEIPYGDFTRITSYATQQGLTYYDTPSTPNDNLDNQFWYRISSTDSVGESYLSGACSYVDYSAFDRKPIPHLSWTGLF